MTGHPIRRDLLLAVIFGVGSVLLVGVCAWFAFADAYRADETGTAATGAPAILLGGAGGIALLTLSAWYFTKASDRMKRSQR